MEANLENAAVAIGLEKVSFHSNPKERQCQRMLRLPHNYTHLTCGQINAQNSPSQASTIRKSWISRCSSWIWKRQRGTRDQIANVCWIIVDHWKSKRIPPKYLFLLYWLCKSLCVDHHKLWKILKEMGIPDHLTCLLRNMYVGQEATVRTGHETTPGFK